MKAVGSVFDGYQSLSMIGYVPKLLPCVRFFHLCVCVCAAARTLWAASIFHLSGTWGGGGGDWSGCSPLLFLKQMHLQLALSKEREGKHAAGVEICFGSSALMALDLCRRL